MADGATKDQGSQETVVMNWETGGLSTTSQITMRERTTADGVAKEQGSQETEDVITETGGLSTTSQIIARERTMGDGAMKEQGSQEMVVINWETGGLSTTILINARKRTLPNGVILQQFAKRTLDMYSETRVASNTKLINARETMIALFPTMGTEMEQASLECYLILDQVPMQLQENDVSHDTVLQEETSQLNDDDNDLPDLIEGSVPIHNQTHETTTTLMPPPHRCSCNWKESSKAMEPNGIVDCAAQIWANGDWMKKFVSDDDSSSRRALHHPIPIQI